MVEMIFTVIGGLGIFLLGMKYMSDGLQAIAGNGLRRLISMVTDKRLMATGVGVLVTCLVQSSSVTTVMVVGFVNSGFMTLIQAIGVIMGANIGTTITGWVLVLKIGKYGLPLVGVAAFVYLFSKKDRVRYTAMFIMGLGMIFLGLEFMKQGFSVVKDLPEFEAWFQAFTADSFIGIVKCAAVGCILTCIVQSSSATLGITIALASKGIIPFETAAALILGENLGTTITALLASLNTTTNAKRAAYFHTIFNVIGVAWIISIFPWYTDLINNIIGGVPELPAEADEKGWDAYALVVTASIAAVHSVFNIANTVIFMPFLPFFAKALNRFVPEKKHKEQPHLTSLDIRMLETPAIAIEQSRVEILHMGTHCMKMLAWVKELIGQDQLDDELVKKVFHREEVLDTIQAEVVVFMTSLLAANVPRTVIDDGRHQLRMADEYESISDYLATILKDLMKIHMANIVLSKDERDALLTMHDEVADYVQMINKGYEQRHPEIITKAHSLASDVDHRFKKLRRQLITKMTEGDVDPVISMHFTAILNSYRRVKDHALNIAEALAGEN